MDKIDLLNLMREGELMFDVEQFVSDKSCRERKRSLPRRFAKGSFRTTIVKRVSVQGLMIVDVPVDIHVGEVVVEKDNLGSNCFVSAKV
ncbi:hypothetical protein PsorP6_015143 [Peronosclerospora sorghi]|uniref:Uncharacterized protein n=1 Tax=Peronosclerospora sorghi TaxID=230839 RepID=A0ACC0VV17_9STRA|nr:hypothetical protein PsorP6_015143 [Peronosclerospora sorghi]